MIQKKICMVGSFAVGKTSLVSRFVTGIFSDKYQTTVGVKIDKKRIDFEGNQVNLIVWDLHGEDEFQKVSTSFLRGSSGLLFVVDGTRPATLDVALNLKKRAEAVIGEIPLIFVFNKKDLQEDWAIDSKSIEELESQGYPVVTTSAKTELGVEEAFRQLTSLIME